jgi:hypothetical protein
VACTNGNSVPTPALSPAHWHPLSLAPLRAPPMRALSQAIEKDDVESVLVALEGASKFKIPGVAEVRGLRPWIVERLGSCVAG